MPRDNISRLAPILAGLGLLVLLSCSDKGKTTGPFTAPNPETFPNPYTEPTWYPNGRAIMFNYTPLVRRYRDPDTGRIKYVFAESLAGLWTVNVDGSGLRRLTNGYLREPDWDPAGVTLAFAGGDIWTVAGSDTGLAAGTERQVTTIGGVAPSWRPDGEAIAFGIGGVGLFVVPRSGGEAREIGEQGWAFPDWSPSGDSLVFIGTVGSTRGVCVADSTGLGLRLLWGPPRANLGPPRWSPVGGKIAVAGRVGTGPYVLWVMGSDGSSPHSLTRESVQQFVAWSPDGKEIAYVRSEYADTSLTNGTIWIIDVETGVKRQLTFNSPGN